MASIPTNTKNSASTSESRAVNNSPSKIKTEANCLVCVLKYLLKMKRFIFPQFIMTKYWCNIGEWDLSEVNEALLSLVLTCEHWCRDWKITDGAKTLIREETWSRSPDHQYVSFVRIAVKIEGHPRERTTSLCYIFCDKVEATLTYTMLYEIVNLNETLACE